MISCRPVFLTNSGWIAQRRRKEENMHRVRRTPVPKPDHDPLDLDALLHPANAFARPADVINDPDLTLSEKRAILASWASDACAVEAVPALRQPPGSDPVRFDDIMDALRELDRQSNARPTPHYRRVLAERHPGVFGRKSRKRPDDHGPSLN
jgi:hypothetical protein